MYVSKHCAKINSMTANMMKLLGIFVVLVSSALCYAGATPVIPKDNSHYVEGQSRYIWMPDGDDELHLVDLHAPVDEEFLKTRNGANNAYWLFTRQNPTSRQVIVMDNQNSIRNSHYSSTRPTNVIVHGWNSKGTTDWVPRTTAALLANQNVNVFVVDWSRAASGLYGSSVQAVPGVGRHIASFLQFVFNTVGGNWNNVHLIGHSLGAHVVANAGRAARTLPARVTGLDPAGPQFNGNSNSLRRNAGQYVEAIHTDGYILGIMTSSGHADFYPNGGQNPQPGCRDSACSHSRATLLFAATVQSNHLVGRRCNNLSQAINMQCSGDRLNMGNNLLRKSGSGTFGLITRASWPF